MRGGKRQNAGRKATGRATVSIRVPVELKDDFLKYSSQFKDGLELQGIAELYFQGVKRASEKQKSQFLAQEELEALYEVQAMTDRLIFEQESMMTAQDERIEENSSSDEQQQRS
jgi:hypothetical protein